jgi:hypothetical protein
MKLCYQKSKIKWRGIKKVPRPMMMNNHPDDILNDQITHLLEFLQENCCCDDCIAKLLTLTLGAHLKNTRDCKIIEKVMNCMESILEELFLQTKEPTVGIESSSGAVH